MSSIAPRTVFDDLLDILSEGANAERLQRFRLPEGTQQRLDDLLEKNREGTLTDIETGELESFEQLEHVVRLLKVQLNRKRRDGQQ